MSSKKDGQAPGLERALGALKQRRTRLDALDDELAEAIIKIEEQLRELRLGVKVSTVVESRTLEPTGDTWLRLLSWAKNEGKWRLVLEVGLDHDDELNAVPLASVARDTRAEIFHDGHIADLITAAVTQVDEKIQQREGALAAAQTVTDAFAKAKAADSDEVA